MKKLLLWLLMVALFLALILGGSIGAMYMMAGKGDLPQDAVTLGGIPLETIGYDWSVPVLGGVVDKHLQQPTNLTVQKLGDFGEETPVLAVPAWATRSELTLVAPDGTTALQGSAEDYQAYHYAQNGEYEMTLTLWQNGAAMAPAKPTGWYRYRARFAVNIQPKAQLSAARIGQGGVVAVLVTGILDGSTPALETDLGDVWFRPVNGGWMGYIPVTYNAEAGTHTLALACGALAQQIELDVTPVSTGSAEVAATTDPPGAAEEFRNAIWPLYTQGAGEKLWNGNFAAPTTYGIKAAYGSVLTTNGTRSGVSTGLTYAALADTQVTATQAGRVVYAGTLGLTGGTVVIDHGCGVKSYLYGMDTVAVERGQDVALGDVVGTAGGGEHDLIFELRIGSKSVDPAQAIAGTGGLQFREAA